MSNYPPGVTQGDIDDSAGLTEAAADRMDREELMRELAAEKLAHEFTATAYSMMRQLERPCSTAHVHMNILTPNGNTATILGDPNMPRKTMDALAQMIDAVVKAANDGTLQVP